MKPRSDKKPDPLQAIRAKCLECSGGIKAEVYKCPIQDCPLWIFHKRSHVITDALETKPRE